MLDAGCGTGENALAFAAAGFEVVGVDAVDAAVAAARAKAEARGLAAEFLVHDALALGELGRRFGTVVDSGLFHTFDDGERRRYVASLAAATAPGARVHVLCFSEHEHAEGGPRRVTQAELREAFDRPPFRVLRIEPADMDDQSGRRPQGVAGHCRAGRRPERLSIRRARPGRRMAARLARAGRPPTGRARAGRGPGAP